MGFRVAFSHFVFEWGSGCQNWVCGFVIIFLCARVSKTCVLLDFDLCYFEVLDIDLGTIT